MFLEYDWTSLVYRVRFGLQFISWRGEHSFPSLEHAKAALAAGQCRLGRKTDSRTWRIETVEQAI